MGLCGRAARAGAPPEAPRVGDFSQADTSRIAWRPGPDASGRCAQRGPAQTLRRADSRTRLAHLSRRISIGRTRLAHLAGQIGIDSPHSSARTDILDNAPCSPTTFTLQLQARDTRVRATRQERPGGNPPHTHTHSHTPRRRADAQAVQDLPRLGPQLHLRWRRAARLPPQPGGRDLRLSRPAPGRHVRGPARRSGGGTNQADRPPGALPPSRAPGSLPSQ